MKTATALYRWTAKTSSRCLGRYYTASTLPEAIKAGKEFVTREFHGTGSILIEAFHQSCGYIREINCN